MPPLRTIKELDAFLCGMAMIASVHTPETSFESFVTMFDREETPLATILAGHTLHLRPHKSHFAGRMPQPHLLSHDELEAFLYEWLRRPAPHLPPADRRGDDKDAGAYKLSVAIGEIFDGVELNLGPIKERYGYRLENQIFHDLCQSMIESQHILFLGQTKALIICLSVVPDR